MKAKLDKNRVTRRKRPKRPDLLRGGERYRLLYGPYEPPRLPRNLRLFCERRGYVKVGSAYSSGRIPWPRRYRTNSIILCGDLVRAVKMESVEAICYHWGVGRNVVQVWRKALGVPENNPGTQALRRTALADARQERQRRAMLRAENPPIILKRPPPPAVIAHPLTRPAVSDVVKRRIAHTGRHINPDLRLWTAKEERLLGTAPDAEVARKIKRGIHAVRTRRNILGIAAWNVRYSRPWTRDEEALLGKIPDRELARKLKRTFLAVQARREIQGLPPVNPQRRRFTPQEDALLGTMHDEELARKLGRKAESIQQRRLYLKIPMGNPRIHRWTLQEDTWLGKTSDEEVAKRLRLPVSSVIHRRTRLGIPIHDPKVCRWTAEEIALLGTLPDREVAGLVHRTNAAVKAMRCKLGIPLRHPRHEKWKPDELTLLGKYPDTEVAARTGHSLQSILWIRRRHRIRLSKRARAPRRKAERY